MFSLSISWYIFTLTLLELIIKTHPTLHDSSHGFISKNSRYFDDELAGIHEEVVSLRTPHLNDVSLKLPIKFEPTFLDFKQRPLGVPHLEKVTLFNVDKNRSIDMTSISGSTVHFHSSFFEDRKIPPNGNTSFNVVFLGREEGFLESSLFIHTSEGYLKYNVKGASTFSHYRIRPIVGVKLPLNSTFTPLIHIYNPHSQPLQIVEIFSSGGGFYLELPTGEQEGPNDLWEIPAQHTKAVIRVRFKAQVVQNYTAYVRIKLNDPDETLVVPLEVQVTDTPGVLHLQGYVDFGVGGSLEGQRDLGLCLRNPHSRPLRVHSVSSGSRAVRARYHTVRLPPEGGEGDEEEGAGCVEVGTLTVDWKTAYETKDFSGKIIVKYRSGKNRSEIPYHLTVLKGGLTFDPLITTYFMNDKMVDLSSRVFKVKNEFEYTVEVKNVTFPQEANSYFKIETNAPKVLKPGQEVNVFNIKLKNNIRMSDLQLNSNIVLHTNISNILVPLLSYNGKLQVHLPFKSKDYSLDIGLIGFDSKKEIYFMIVNHNPVSLHLKHVHSSIPMTQVEVQGCGSGDHRLVLFQPTFTNLTKCHHLKSNQYAVLKVTVTTSHVEGQVWGEIYIETQFENLKVPVHFKIAPGRLDVSSDKLVFDHCFPAKVCSHPVRIHSTFNDPMIIEDIITLPPDKRISSRHTGHILARTSKVIGHMFLNPDLHCQADCYTGLQTDTSAQWLKTFSLSKFVSDFDLHLVNVFYNRYLNLTSNGTKKWQNITLRLDTSEVRGHIFKTRVKMSWPRLIVEQNTENYSIFTFPLTQVGNISYLNVTLRNPASYNVVVQLVFDRDYPNFQILQNGLPPNLLTKSSGENSTTHGFFFPNRSKDAQLDFFSEMLGVTVDPDTLPLLLKPGQSQSVLIGFRTTDTSPYSALLLLRNNLTILEVVRLNAQGASPAFKFGNRKPGSAQFLTFDLNEKHLKECEKLKAQNTAGTPYLTVKRTFTARNTGDVPLYVQSFHINDYPCEGYGFKVIDCEPFMLPPNSTKRIDIAFTPDLTLTKITRTLILATSLNIPVNYTLYSTITSSFLNACSEVIARPFWEIYLSYLTVGSMCCLLVVIVFVAMIDADRVRRQAMGSFVAPSSPAVQPVLDLRLVGQQIREEIQSAKSGGEKVVVCEDKASQKELEDEGKKFEMERYTVLVPVTGKAKKKLGKRNSGEPSQSEESSVVQVQEKPEKRREKCCEVKQKTKEKDKELKSEEKDKKILEIAQKEAEEKKPSSQPRKAKNTVVPVYEEESSSTTTDSSSSNFEDPEKENNQRNTQTVCSKINCRPTKIETVKPVIQENLNYSVETKPVTFSHNHHHNRIKHQKPLPKSQKTSEKLGKDKDFHHKPNDGVPVQKHHSHMRDKKRDRSGKDRKDKSYHKKSSMDKKLAKEAGGLEKQRKSLTSFNISLPPVTSTPCVWGESRAKFSDVVARSDAASVSTRSHNPKSVAGKPTMYVEPYKQTPITELGPIGSRRTDGRSSAESNRRSLEDNFDSFMQSNGLIRDSSNSFFSDEIRLDSSGRESCYLDDMANVGGGWSHQQGYDGCMMEPGTGSDTGFNMEDPWNQSLLNSSSYWDSYNPLLLEAHLQAETAASQPAASRSAGYLWGSSAVWQPWAPEAPGTPTRTPPGFDEFLHRKRDDSPQPRNSYSPFNTSPLWTQQQSNPWNYSQGQ
ncbi:unnamed protein product [Phaedon cochleariae]|uniref:Transmembrane protein 131 n=1 Tax=Phaedon cochleariae TaxID=80249 RepID=A0A9P0GUX6_PHACE|nr:unnamed protein product [Phaedon cochleariae]